MKYILILLLAIINCCGITIAQTANSKPLITDLVPWESIGSSYSISGNGKYVKYQVDDKIYLVNTQGKSLLTAEFVQNGFITNDSKYFIFKKEEHIYVYNIESRSLDSIRSNQLVYAQSGIDKWVCYKNEDAFRLRKLDSGKEFVLPAKTAEFDPTGRYLLLRSDMTLGLFDLSTLKIKTIVSGKSVVRVQFDKSSTGLAFVVKDSAQKELLYYNLKNDALKSLISLNDKHFQPGQDFSDNWMNNPLRFSGDGTFVLFRVTKPQVEETPDAENGAPGVQIWSYKDKWLKAQGGDFERKDILMSISIDGIGLLQLETPEIIVTEEGVGMRHVISQNYRSESIGYWHERHNIQYYLTDLATGERKLFIPEVGPISNRPPVFSPGEKFVLFFDYLAGHYFSYEIATGIKRNISSQIPEPLILSDADIPVARISSYTGGWDDIGNKVVIYSRRDIWIADLYGNLKPINITNGFGKRNNIKFHLVDDIYVGKTIMPLRTGDELNLVAFNYTNKQNGFWKIKLGSNKDPELLVMEDAMFYFFGVESGKPLVKASQAKGFILTKQTAAKSPNLFYSKDLKNFVQLSNVYPEKKYNWVTSRLLTWNIDDTTQTSGILYLPENFDSTKKYPVIFYYYMDLADGLHVYRNPEPSTAAINMPWYVSNGYAVVMPDIVFRGGHTAKSVTNCMVSAANYLSRFPWVDMKRLGLQGHSFGGYETNCIIANTNIFAAAQEGAGVSNVSSCFGQPGFGEPTTFSGSPNGFLLENSQLNTQTTPWENPEVYVENSPIFRADKIETPLLILHNKGDDIVSFMQAHEMYNALNRQRKRVWLLHYDGSGHTVNEGGLDFSRRQQQFFNHYLKGAPAPLWMVEEIPFKSLGKRSGLQLDTLNRTP